MRAFPSRTGVLIVFALALGLTGCASGGGSGDSAPVTGSSANRIVRAELEPLAQIDGYQAVERLRPRWLQSRGGSTGSGPIFYVDGARRNDLNDLRSFRTADIEGLQFMSAGDASTRFGTGHADGAILLTTRR